MNTMTYKGYSAQVMESERLVGDSIHSLPPGRALDVHQAETFNVYPENWVKKGAFVIPVKPNKGLWFNFRMNDENNTAVLLTVKGCNPITGLQSSGFHLDKYVDKCPKHGCDFVSERFCPECGYKWPDRSYLSGTPLWWDGWVADGAIRQFYFTEEMMRDIATHMIGKENTVPAFGFAFYSPKIPREVYTAMNISTVSSSDIKYGYMKQLVPTINNVYYSSTSSDTLKSFNSSLSTKKNIGRGLLRCKSESAPSCSLDALYSAGAGGQSAETYTVGASMLDAPGLERDRGFPPSEECSADMVKDYPVDQERSFTPQKEVAVGAGAKIHQELPIDTYPVDSWKDTPDAVMTIYFVFQEEFKNMIAGGFKDFKDCKEGMLNGLPVG